jgi:hypothetical protein
VWRRGSINHKNSKTGAVDARWFEVCKNDLVSRMAFASAIVSVDASAVPFYELLYDRKQLIDD